MPGIMACFSKIIRVAIPNISLVCWCSFDGKLRPEKRRSLAVFKKKTTAWHALSVLGPVKKWTVSWLNRMVLIRWSSSPSYMISCAKSALHK